MKRPVLLVLRALGLGDFLAGVPAYRALARAFPSHRRVLAMPQALHPLLTLLPGVFDEAIDAGELQPIPIERVGDVDVAVDLHGRGPASHRILTALRPNRLIAFRTEEIAESASGAPFIPGEHEVKRWCRLLRHAGIPADPSELALDEPATLVPSRFHDATIVHPGAASASRRWPPERWAEIVRDAEAHGERVVITGSAAERELAASVTRLSGLARTHDVAGRTSILELATLVARARRVVCGDTGIAHLATAYGIPSVVLFGPTPPQEWGPPDRAQHRVIWHGGRGDPHGASLDDGLAKIATAEVLAAIDALRQAS